MKPDVDPDILDALQKHENDGRGVSCVKTIHLYLTRGDVDSAAMVAYNENDKIRGYPLVHRYLRPLRDYGEYLIMGRGL